MRGQILVSVILFLQGIIDLTEVESSNVTIPIVTTTLTATRQKNVFIHSTEVLNSTEKIRTTHSNNNSLHSLLNVNKPIVKSDTSIPRMDGEIPNTFYNLTADVEGEDVVFRVVNGERAVLGTVPYQVGFYKLTGNRPRHLDGHSADEFSRDILTRRLRPNFRKRYYAAFCGGTLVTRSKIITAAHCFVDERKKSNCNKGTLSQSSFKNQYAVVASLLTNQERYYGTNSQWRQMRRGSYPKQYRFPTADICVIHTAKPFYLNDFVKTLPYMRRVKKNFSGQSCMVSGFGRISHNVQSRYLLYATVTILPDLQCNRIHRRDMSKFICTSDVMSDVHKGDSGGPLACGGELAGVVSGKVLTKRSSAFFTRIDSYRTFLRNCSFNTLSNSGFLFFILLIKSVLSTDLIS